jgi:hypothetical protein
MKFAVIVYENPREFESRTDPARAQAYWAAYQAYSHALNEAGVAAGGAGLQPPSVATSLRVRDSKWDVQDGPFAETKEQLGGFFVIDVPDLDTALKWAARCPAASTCGVEVRPLLGPLPS